ncbi:MAG: IS21 family transposase [Desulforhopalus sp.]|nr:IS21 family transposase [Desulforhopalus sp.]
MQSRKSGLTQETSAAKAGVSIRSGHRIETGGKKAKSPRKGRTRIDPFASVWTSELVPLLEKEPKLSGLTLWEYLDEHHPNAYPHKLLRTLQRRVKHWRATHGPDNPVMFRQSLPPGQQGLSDFTHPRSAVTVAGQPFPHLIYQYRLAYSGWRCTHVVRGGESYSALAQGVQNALHKSGGVPVEHRTDSLSAAYVNQSQKKQLTHAYEGLCQHYGMTGTTNNPGLGHENGAVETSHASLKHRLDQAIKLRGSADFDSVADYQALINRCTDRLNRYTLTRFEEEQKYLQPLPKYRFMDYSEISVKVTTSSTIAIKRGLYTVPSRLIGETLRIHLYHDKLIGFVGQTQVIELPRVFAQTPKGRARRIDYRHVIHSLSAKPQAFRFSNFRDELFPNDNYRQLWKVADQNLPAKDACKWMVAVLRIAADHQCEEELGQTLLLQAQTGTLPSLKSLQTQYLKNQDQTELVTKQHDIADYDKLLSGCWIKPHIQGGSVCLSR